MTADFETLTRQMRQQGHKLTQPRGAILRVLLAASTPLAPNEIQEQGQVFCSDLGLVTVYRTLELMEEIGLVRPVHVAEGCHGYVLATPGHTHHMVCVRCHTVVEISGCEMGDFLQMVAEQTGYAVTGHWLEIAGLCRECQRGDA
jgi:Fur family ferric uptake transcriptional regulator